LRAHKLTIQNQIKEIMLGIEEEEGEERKEKDEYVSK